MYAKVIANCFQITRLVLGSITCLRRECIVAKIPLEIFTWKTPKSLLKFHEKTEKILWMYWCCAKNNNQYDDDPCLGDSKFK